MLFGPSDRSPSGGGGHCKGGGGLQKGGGILDSCSFELGAVIYNGAALRAFRATDPWLQHGGCDSSGLDAN